MTPTRLSSAALLAEAAVADRAFQIVLDRDVSLRRAGERGDRQIALRVRTALADADGPGTWPELITKAESLRFAAAEGTYVCLRGARWCAWNGQPERAETLYRLAMKLGAEADLDLDVENALWSLTVLYTSPDHWNALFETNQLALSIDGTRSHVAGNSRTRQRSYQYMANERVPDAHLWTRYRLLESIRSGCLMDELESHGILARIYRHSGYQVLALEHAVLGGARALVKELAPNVGAWPDSLATVVDGPASWVRPAALLALKHVGDFAPPEVARELVHQLVQQLHRDADDLHAAPALFEALQAVVLEATDDDLRRMVPVLERAAPREPGGFLLTDLGVGMIAARVYRFRPSLRHRAASLLGEMAIGSHTGEWWSALGECGDDTDELVEAIERVAERERLDLADTLAELGHLTAATRTLWSQRLAFVAEHPLGPAVGTHTHVEVRRPAQVP